MAAIAFDPLGYTRELEASGVPRNQAEVHAKAMTATFLHNFDALVTRDYLDTRFAGLEASWDKRFTGLEASWDKRFAESEASSDKRFAEFRLEVHQEIAKLRGELGDMKAKLNMQSWMLALIIAGMFGPLVQSWFA